MHLGADGLGRIPELGGFVRLDVPRQWELIKALLTSPHIEVQWLFASGVVEALVIEYALSRGDDPEIIWRAENVMLEPADSLPHDDHLHLRIACSLEEAQAGCSGGGPYWEWLPAVPQAPIDDPSLLQLIADEAPLESLDTEPLAIGAPDGGGA